MKNIFPIVILIISMISCKENKDRSFSSQKESVAYVLKEFPMIDENLITVKKIDLDSLSITLLRNSNKQAYDEVLVFEKKNNFYAIPFFSNMYADYWNFENDNESKLFPKTNSTFGKELSKLIVSLNLNSNEFGVLFDELMNSTLNTEKDLQYKSNLFQDIIYMSDRMDKHSSEETDSCKTRSNLLFEQILKDNKDRNLKIMFQYYFDKKNGRVYKFENTSKNFREIKFNFKTYRIDCYYQQMTL